MILTFIIILGLALLGFAYWMGVFQSIKITETTFHGGTFLYKDYRGHIKNIGSAFNLILRDLEEFKKNEIRKFNLPVMGIYYDDPGNLKDPEALRASIGLLL